LRRMAVSALGKMEDIKVESILLRALEDDNPQVIQYAIRSLQKVKSIRGKEKIGEIIKTTDKDYLKRAAEEYILGIWNITASQRFWGKKMSYLTIKDIGKFEFKEKKSVFIGEAMGINTEDEAKEFINKIKGENKEARHNVFAYILGENNGIQRYSDDGEPQGTGGMPILEIIKRNNLTDIVVVVTRYFGGILLGTGGLTRAYSKAAAESIKQATTVEKVDGCELTIKLDYELLGKVQHNCQLNKWMIENVVYTDKVELSIFIEISKVELIIDSIINITSARCETEISGQGIYFKNDEKLYKASSK